MKAFLLVSFPLFFQDCSPGNLVNYLAFFILQNGKYTTPLSHSPTPRSTLKARTNSPQQPLQLLIKRHVFSGVEQRKCKYILPFLTLQTCLCCC